MPDTCVIIDTGPIVAYLYREEEHHLWAVDQFRSLPAPLLTCEAVLTEALFLLRRVRSGSERLFSLLMSGAITIDFVLQDELDATSKLIAKYANVPASLADACLVRMAELRPEACIWTLDADFRVYRRHRRQTLPLVTPT